MSLAGPGSTGPPRSSSNSLVSATWGACRPCLISMSPHSILMEKPTQAERLHKILSRAGVASRRAAETLIRAGRVGGEGGAGTPLGTTAGPRRGPKLGGGRALTLSPAPPSFPPHQPRRAVGPPRGPAAR